jgi:exonuclease SbcC
MSLKSLHLENFQKHPDLTLDFTEGVNVIYGSSDTGKSCVRRAIEWLYYNKKIDGIRKSGTKVTTVTATLVNGIIVSRVRSASINRYVIKKPDEKEQVFDSIGKSIPDEVKDVLKSSVITVDGEDICLNSAPQLSLPFLFDKSPAFRMKLFNLLTGNDVLDNCFSSFNKDILRLNKEIKRDKASLEEQEESIENTEIEKEKNEFLYKRAKTLVKKIREKEDRYSKLLEVKDLCKNNEDNIKDITEELRIANKLEVIEVKQLTLDADRLDSLKEVKTALEQTDSGLDGVTDELKKKSPEIGDLTQFKGKIERLDELNTLTKFISVNKLNIEHTVKSKTEETSLLEDRQEEYLDLLKQCKVCPTCNTEMTEEHLKEVKI